MDYVLNNYFSCEPGSYTPERVIEENKIHKKQVIQTVNITKAIMNYRARHHDNDKNILENAEVLSTALNTGDFKKWEEIHYLNNRHHYQWFLNQENLDKVTLFDFLECCCDNVAARLGRKGEPATWEEEYRIYIQQGFTEFQAHIMANTFMEIQTLAIEMIKNYSEEDNNED